MLGNSNRVCACCHSKVHDERAKSRHTCMVSIARVAALTKHEDAWPWLDESSQVTRDDRTRDVPADQRLGDDAPHARCARLGSQRCGQWERRDREPHSAGCCFSRSGRHVRALARRAARALALHGLSPLGRRVVELLIAMRCERCEVGYHPCPYLFSVRYARRASQKRSLSEQSATCAADRTWRLLLCSLCAFYVQAQSNGGTTQDLDQRPCHFSASASRLAHRNQRQGSSAHAGESAHSWKAH